MPIKDASVVNLLFQLEFNTELQLSDIFRFLKGRSDVDLNQYVDQGLLTEWAEAYASEQQYCDPGNLGAKELYEYLSLQANSSEIIALMEDEDIVDVSEKSVEWLVETLMERNQTEIEVCLEVHGFKYGS